MWQNIIKFKTIFKLQVLKDASFLSNKITPIKKHDNQNIPKISVPRYRTWSCREYPGRVQDSGSRGFPHTSPQHLECYPELWQYQNHLKDNMQLKLYKRSILVVATR